MQSEQTNSELSLELNLPGANCLTFSLDSEFSLAGDAQRQLGARIREAISPDDGRPHGESALYASKYMVGDYTVGIAGRLGSIPRQEDQGFSVSIRYFQIDADQAVIPQGFHEFAELSQIATDIIGEIDINCRATFNYELGERVRSRVDVPSPLLLPDLDSPTGVTHIESVELSRREDGKQTHLVLVYPTYEDNGVKVGVGHDVTFAAMRILAPENIGELFEIAKRLSMSLMAYATEGPYDTSPNTN